MPEIRQAPYFILEGLKSFLYNQLQENDPLADFVMSEIRYDFRLTTLQKFIRPYPYQPQILLLQDNYRNMAYFLYTFTSTMKNRELLENP